MTTTTHPVTPTTPTPRTGRRSWMGRPLAALLLAAGVLLGTAGMATASSGGGSSSGSFPRPLTLTVDPNLVHPDAPVVIRRLPRLDPAVVKIDCVFDPGAGLFRCP